jgi:hypothetical protein
MTCPTKILVQGGNLAKFLVKARNVDAVALTGAI